VLTRTSSNSEASVSVHELGYGMDDQGVAIRLLKGAKDSFLFFIASRPTLRPIYLHIQGAPGNVSPGVKLQNRETDHSPPSRAELKNVEAIPPLPHVCSWRDA
jgi:hypothetical protein